MNAALVLLILINNVGRIMALPNLASDNYYKARLTDGVMIDSIAVTKSTREMRVFSHGKLLKKYHIHLGLQPVGPKQVAGDFKTPEGLYRINAKNPRSLYHKSLGISYPNKEDILRAKRMGRSPGGDIVIHGWPNGKENAGPRHYQNDWTSGCIGLLNKEIDELFEHVSVGIPIFIEP